MLINYDDYQSTIEIIDYCSSGRRHVGALTTQQLLHCNSSAVMIKRKNVVAATTIDLVVNGSRCNKRVLESRTRNIMIYVQAYTSCQFLRACYCVLLTESTVVNL